MDDTALIDAMRQLTEKMADYEHFGLTIERAHDEMKRLDGEMAALRKTLARGLLANEAKNQPSAAKGRTKGFRYKTPRARPDIKTPAAIAALETIKASNGAGVPARDLGVKPWVLGLLARAGQAKHLPNGNWVAA